MNANWNRLFRVNPGYDMAEKVINRIPIPCEAFGNAGEVFRFKPDYNIHTFTSYFGGVMTKKCVEVSDTPATASFPLRKIGEFEHRRFFVKLTLQLERPKEFTALFSAKINGNTVFDGESLVETVSGGWPTLYFFVNPEFMQRGKNMLEISCRNADAEKGRLFLHAAEIVELEPLADFCVVHSPLICDCENEFTVSVFSREKLDVSLLKISSSFGVTCCPDTLSALAQTGTATEAVDGMHESYRGYVYDIPVQAACPGHNLRATVSYENKSAEFTVPLCVDSAQKFVTGTDSDDIRQDNLGEMPQALSIMVESEMGCYMNFRPKEGRNFAPGQYATQDLLNREMDYLQRKNCMAGVTRWPLPDLSGPIHSAVEGQLVHEPYLVLNPILWQQNPLEVDPALDRFRDPALRNAPDFAEKRKAYVNFIRRMKDEADKLGIKSFVGEPSLLSHYLVEAGVDNIMLEAVSNIPQMLSTIRGGLSAHGRPHQWGAHIPPDWYLGFPHDKSKNERISRACFMIYMSGAEVCYLENALFKTVTVKRLDREDIYCRRNRDIMRTLRHYSRLHKIIGRPVVRQAFLYGNLNSIMWPVDEGIDELQDNQHWDRYFWGEWPDGGLHEAFHLTKSWLPHYEYDRESKRPHGSSLVPFFSSNPCGEVDIIPAHNVENSDYETLAFTGWNTMTPEFLEGLMEYVKKGGTLFLSAAHLDTRIRIDDDVNLIKHRKLAKFLGAKLTGDNFSASKAVFVGKNSLLPNKKFSLKKTIDFAGMQLVSANVCYEDDAARPVVIENQYGKGRVVFSSALAYPTEKAMLRFYGEIIKALPDLKDRPFAVGRGSEYCYVAERFDEESGARQIHVLDIDWENRNASKEIGVRLWNKNFSLSLKNNILREIWMNGPLAVSLDSMMHAVRSFEMDKKSGVCTVHTAGTGTAALEIFCDSASLKQLNVHIDGKNVFSAKASCAKIKLPGTGHHTITVGFENGYL